MSIRRFLSVCALALPVILLTAAVRLPANTTPIAPRPPAAWDEADPADSLYRMARQAFSREEFSRAARMFADITKKYPKSAYAGEALYYRAYALYRLGGDSDLRDAVTALNDAQSRYPRAKTAGDADELRLRIRGTLAKRGDAPSAAIVSSAASDTTPCTRGVVRDDDNDVRMAALNALLQMDAESAMPILRQVLQKRDGCTAALRKKAVFLVAQKPSSGTEALLGDIIKNDPSRDVKDAGVFWMGQIHTDRAAIMLEELATSSPDSRIRETALFSLGQQNSSRGWAFMRRLAETDGTPRNVREKAVWQLGQQPSAENADYLKALFGKLDKSRDEDGLRKNILFSLAQMHGFGNDRWLVNVGVNTSESVEVRKHALWCAGQAGVPANELISIYDRLTDAAIKEHLIWVLSDARDRSAGDKLVDIAKNDKDQKMRQKALFWLGQKNDPRVKQIILDILKD